jgi:hypothetical protein
MSSSGEEEFNENAPFRRCIDDEDDDEKSDESEKPQRIRKPIKSKGAMSGASIFFILVQWFIKFFFVRCFTICSSSLKNTIFGRSM